MNTRTKISIAMLTAVAVLTGRAGAENIAASELSHSATTVYVQVSDARFDSYLLVKRVVSAENKAISSDEFFYIPRPNSRGRERELAEWRRHFNLIVSAATLAESVQPKISQIKEEFAKANRAAECWTVDRNKERRITITVVGSADKMAIEREYRATSRDFLANPSGFTCKYTYKTDPSTPQL
ncbi:MAG TPA: hypothetical protein VH684_08665 [Xanthobacteraceae bacterium]|jgi:hypothetical protein